MYQQHTWSFSKIVVAIALIISAVGAYTVFFSQSRNVSAADEFIVEGEEPKQIIGQDLLLLLEKIESLKLDETIFTDVTFTSLQDYTVEITPETPGRVNPFAPLPTSKSAPKAR